MGDINPQEFGKLQAEVSALRRDVDRITTTLDEMNATLTNVQQQMSEARGGWKTMMLLGGASASLGGLLASFLAQK